MVTVSTWSFSSVANKRWRSLIFAEAILIKGTWNIVSWRITALSLYIDFVNKAYNTRIPGVECHSIPVVKLRAGWRSPCRCLSQLSIQPEIPACHCQPTESRWFVPSQSCHQLQAQYLLVQDRPKGRQDHRPQYFRSKFLLESGPPKNTSWG